MTTGTLSTYKPPLFSIIVGSYNQMETLPLLVEALNNQTFKDFDVHFCDDGSDESILNALFAIDRDIERRTDGPTPGKIRFPFEVHRQPHKGMRLAKNLNQGVNVAEGEYCVFIMADSFPDPYYLEVLSQFVAPHRVLNGVRYHVHEGKGVDVDYRLKKAIIPPENAILLSQPWSQTTGNGLCVPTEAMRKYGGWPEYIEGYGGDDNELVARLFYKGYVIWSIIDAKLYHHWHKMNASQSNNKKVIKLIESYAR